MLQEARDCQKIKGPHKGSLAHAASLGAVVNRTDLLSPTQAEFFQENRIMQSYVSKNR